LRARRRGSRRPPVRRRSRRRRGGRRRVLPAARRAGGVRPAAGPRRHHPGPAADVAARGDRRGGRRRGRRGVVPGEPAMKSSRERAMVPPADFRSYYGRPVLKAPVWNAQEIGGYFFLSGLAGGSALLAAGADLTGRTGLRRATRLVAAGATGLSLGALIRDLGKPSRFVHMLRVVKPTSPMSIGTWILSGFGSMIALSAAGEVAGPVTALVPKPLVRAAGLGAAAPAPAGWPRPRARAPSRPRPARWACSAWPRSRPSSTGCASGWGWSPSR